MPESCDFVLTGDRGWGIWVLGQFAKSLQGQDSRGIPVCWNTTGIAQRAQGLISQAGVSSWAIVSFVPCRWQSPLSGEMIFCQHSSNSLL